MSKPSPSPKTKREVERAIIQNIARKQQAILTVIRKEKQRKVEREKGKV